MGFFSFLKKTEKKAEEPKVDSLLSELLQALREEEDSLSFFLDTDVLYVETANSDFLITINSYFAESIKKLSITIESRDIELTYGFLLDSELEIDFIKETILIKLREFAQAYKQFS